jgi:Lon protease-like protein
MSVIIHIPIFPLPDVILFPHTLLPLHVFEARYRQMVRDCLAGDRRLAMVLLRPGWEADYYGRPPIYPTAGAGEIIEHEELPDGRYNIVLRGTMRIGITAELPVDKPYRVARARPLPDRYPEEDPGALLERVERLKVFYLRALSEVKKGEVEAAKLFSGVKDPGIIVDRIAAAAIADAETRQQVLEAVEVGSRLALVLEHLVAALAQLSDRSAPSEKSSGRQN